MTVALAALELGGTSAPWERLGFAAGADGIRIGTVRLAFAGGEPRGITGWTLRGAERADLDALATRLGDDLGAPRDAVQPGRRIATVRESAGLGLPLAFMTDTR